ncbi:MAG: polysaccharide pyruvyl transferase family protein [Kiritimatiellia bacterium]
MKKLTIGILYIEEQIRPVSVNPGDDIVRDGQRYLLETILGHQNIEWRIFKIARPGQWFRHLPEWMSNIHPKCIWPLWLFRPLNTCSILECDYLLNASGPRLGMGVFYHSLFEPWHLVLRRLLKHTQAPRFINLGFGTNFAKLPSGNNGFYNSLHRQFCREHCGPAIVNTCREELALRLLEECGIPAQFVLCPSVLACHYYGLKPRSGSNGYIALNLHTAGSRRRAEKQKCDTRWIKQVGQFLAHLTANSLPWKFIFHEPMELELARKYFPVSIEDNYILPSSVKEYLEAYKNASVALTSRAHGAYAAASFGVPSACVGSDSRMQMIKALELPSLSWKSASSRDLIKTTDFLINNRNTIRKRLLRETDKAESQYHQILKSVLPSGGTAE